MDAANESKVWDTITTLRGKTTVVVISHGLSVTSFADRTYRLEDGSATALDRSGHTAADALHPERGGSAPQGKRLS